MRFNTLNLVSEYAIKHVGILSYTCDIFTVMIIFAGIIIIIIISSIRKSWQSLRRQAAVARSV
jgi:hypothetical protein